LTGRYRSAVRILHVVQPPYGGAVAAVLLLTREQLEHHEVGVVCHTAGNAAEVARGLGAAVWTMSAPRSVHLMDDARHLLRLRRIMRQFHPDIVHVHSSKAGALGRLAARFERVPVVFSPQNFAFRAYEGSAAARGVFYAIERTLAPLTDCLHVVSDDEYENAVGHGMAPSHRCGKIHNAIDLKPLLRLDPPSVRTPPVIGTFARLYRQKHLELFLDSLAELRGRGVPFRGLLVGDGPLRAHLHARAEKLGLRDTVELDATPHDAVAALRRIDIFALTSSHEACPLTVMEAMAAQRAVVATRVGMVPAGCRGCGPRDGTAAFCRGDHV
jgi:glycosyltransferase involved in cell wall biosynthesis